ncbi:lipopolysaccharide core heptose(II) kinase RfaY [Chryseobacterium gambrini]|uniref:lipopolysaccharide core heptose(II) kinase RfaY n=1 Tax=Chryseobacterium gambrini TaxID=373672 RepID=UPI003D12D22D
MKYTLAPYLKLITEDDNHYLISKYKPNNNYIINSSIYFFLKIFEKPILVETGLVKFCEKFPHLPDGELKKIFETFLNENIKSHVLLSENDILELVLPEHDYTYNIDETIGDYKIVKRIKNSIPIEIYICERKSEYFFLKFISMKKIKDETIFSDYKNKLMREYNTLVKLKQEFINKPIEFLENDEFFYISTEYIEGVSLKQSIEIESDMEVRKEIVKLIIQYYSKLHSDGILHGDIHYGNILVNEEKQIKLVDFEFSNVLNEKANAGQPFFMPPERISENFKEKYINSNTYRSEVYQIGLLVYYVIFKKLPFESKDWKSLVSEKLNYRYKYDKNISESLNLLLINSLEVDPAKRPESANQILELI